uniref:Disease resistance protein RFL1 n=1 Tax=Rhizophora mucronata TaxID=61149 RepID=A0A2P2MMD6_RHIMU
MQNVLIFGRPLSFRNSSLGTSVLPIVFPSVAITASITLQSHISSFWSRARLLSVDNVNR